MLIYFTFSSHHNTFSTQQYPRLRPPNRYKHCPLIPYPQICPALPEIMTNVFWRGTSATLFHGTNLYCETVNILLYIFEWFFFKHNLLQHPNLIEIAEKRKYGNNVIVVIKGEPIRLTHLKQNWTFWNTMTMEKGKEKQHVHWGCHVPQPVLL
jgi:hypothetical protein